MLPSEPGPVLSLRDEWLYQNRPLPSTRGPWSLEDPCEAEGWGWGGQSTVTAPRTAVPRDGDGDRALQGVSLQRSWPLSHVLLSNVHSFLGALGHIFMNPRKFATKRLLLDPIDRRGER